MVHLERWANRKLRVLGARQLAIPPSEVDAAVREARVRHAMNVAWVRTTTDAAIEVGLKRKKFFNAGGVVVIFRRRSGRWKSIGLLLNSRHGRQIIESVNLPVKEG